MTTTCGCPGKWKIAYRYSNPSYPQDTYYVTVSGFELDSLSQNTLSDSVGAYINVTFSCSGINQGLDRPSTGVHFVSASFTKDDPNCVSSPVQRYDCLNGSCVISTQYDTPGAFNSLVECQSTCTIACLPNQICVNPNTFCAPGKVCLERIEYNEIQSLITRILSEI